MKWAEGLYVLHTRKKGTGRDVATAPLDLPFTVRESADGRSYLLRPISPDGDMVEPPDGSKTSKRALIRNTAHEAGGVFSLSATDDQAPSSWHQLLKRAYFRDNQWQFVTRAKVKKGVRHEHSETIQPEAAATLSRFLERNEEYRGMVSLKRGTGSLGGASRPVKRRPPATRRVQSQPDSSPGPAAGGKQPTGLYVYLAAERSQGSGAVHVPIISWYEDDAHQLASITPAGRLLGAAVLPEINRADIFRAASEEWGAFTECRALSWQSHVRRVYLDCGRWWLGVRGRPSPGRVQAPAERALDDFLAGNPWATDLARSLKQRAQQRRLAAYDADAADEEMSEEPSGSEQEERGLAAPAYAGGAYRPLAAEPLWHLAAYAADQMAEDLPEELGSRDRSPAELDAVRGSDGGGDSAADAKPPQASAQPRSPESPAGEERRLRAEVAALRAENAELRAAAEAEEQGERRLAGLRARRRELKGLQSELKDELRYLLQLQAALRRLLQV